MNNLSRIVGIFRDFALLGFIQCETLCVINSCLKIRSRYQGFQFFPVVSLPLVLSYKHSFQYYALDDKPSEAEIIYFGSA